jgi:hypothetical protein
MRPARRIKQAEGLARELHKLLSNTTLSQLLQRTRSASLTAEQEALLVDCGSLLDQMAVALQEDEAALDLRLLEAMLQQQAVQSAGTLVAWVQLQPEQLLSVKSVLGFTATRGSGAPCCWASGVHSLTRAASKAGQQDYDSAATCQMAANMTQQLDESGERCSLNCSIFVTLCSDHTHSDYCTQQGS